MKKKKIESGMPKLLILGNQRHGLTNF